ncbi:ABC transporter substrate-binding protein [Clostridium sediminicola]|uniref:ABC transporter substrate-binding protein n=1 Tax=Clostridium sediminicola TaxID=3114879 RepID=UPI0031F1F514
MKIINKIVSVFLILMLAIGIVGCSSNSNSNNNVAEENKKENTEEIVIAGTRNIAPGEKDAYYCSSVLMVWEPLLTKAEDGSPVLKLAESYSANEDYTVWTFKLNKGVTFHDGEVLNADAVIANFDRMKLGKKPSSFYSMDINKTYPGLLEVNKTNDYTVELVFEKALPTLDFAMTDFGSAMFSPKNFDDEGNFNGLPMGTGPFKLKENVLDEYTIIERNDEYYGEKALAKNIKIKVISDPDTRYSALKSGEVMGVIDLGAIQPVMAKELIKDENFAISYKPNTITHYILVNGNRFPFNDVRMRQAVSLLIDRDLILDSFYGGLGYPTVNVLNQSTPFYKEFKIEHDVEKAKSLAKEVLGDKRASIELILKSGELNRYPNKEEAELLQSQLAEIGIDANITILDSAAWSDATKSGNYNMSLKIKGLSSSEPNSLFKSMMQTDSGLNKSWSFGYSNTEVDELIANVSGELDMEKRKEMYNRLQEISVEELPAIPYFNDVNLIAYNKKIEGYEALNYGVSLDKTKWAE